MQNSYFYRENKDIYSKKLELEANIKARRNRPPIPGFLRSRFIQVGDIIEVTFKRNVSLLLFEGVCISIAKRSLTRPDTTFILRNVILGVGIELTASLFENRLMFSVINDYKRKLLFMIRKSKLYYIRYRLNKESRVRR